MSGFRVPILVLAGIAVSSISAASAQNTDPVALTLDLGFVSTSGNTAVTTFNLGEKLAYTRGRWTFSQLAAAIYGETDGSSTAEQYNAGLRGEYALGLRFAAFVSGDWYRNTFAGITSRFVEGAGLGWKAIQAPRDSLRFEGAITSNQETNVALVETSFAASRTALAYKHLFGAAAALTQAVEWVANLEETDDQRWVSETAIAAPISKQIAIKAAYVLRFDNQPEPGFRDTDRVFTTGLQIVF